MGQRFSDIRRSAKLAQQLTGYISYLQQPRSLTTAYKARGKRTPASILAFGGGLATGESVLTSFEDKPENTALIAVINQADGAAITVPKSPTAVSVNGFRPARVTRVTSTTKTVTEKKSKFTNVDYRKYNADRAAVPFGAKTESSEYIEVVKKLKASLRDPALAICWVSFSPENIAGR